MTALIIAGSIAGYFTGIGVACWVVDEYFDDSLTSSAKDGVYVFWPLAACVWLGSKLAQRLSSYANSRKLPRARAVSAP